MGDAASAARALEAWRVELVATLAQRSCVLTAPTGTGKSTLVPRWLPGRVLVIEPRRVACQALARRVAELEGATLGDGVGYRVRDDEKVGAATRIVFATPGIVLLDLDWALGFDAIVLDEFHERRLDTDWLYAFFKLQGRRLLVMSATIDASRIAADLGGRWFEVAATAFPVDVRYLGAPGDLPVSSDWRVLAPRALERIPDEPGDVLVFLPGKAEIQRLAASLAGRRFQCLELHGSLPLKQQQRVFEPSGERRVILATNVAETSLTLPNVRVVIDSGLVRRTHYYGGRSYLALSSIALDSAQQRAGRAGRTAPGQCLRLWGAAAKLEPQTPPELARESLANFVLWSASRGLARADLPCLDEPPLAAWEHAARDLLNLGALDERGGITERGVRLHRLPLDPWYGRLLVEAQARGTLPDVIDLVAALVHQPRLQLPPPREHPPEPPCDAVALVNAVRGQLEGPRIEGRAELQRLRRRLADLLRAPAPDDRVEVDRRQLLGTVLAADPRSAHVARHRKRHTKWASGGTELELGRESRASLTERLEVLVVLDTHAVGLGRKRSLIATRASAIDRAWLVELGFGVERVGSVKLKAGQLLAEVERVYAGQVLSAEQRPVTGAVARQALCRLLLEGRLFPDALTTTRERLERHALCHLLSQRTEYEHLQLGRIPAPPSLEDWIRERVESLGFETSEDLPLLSPGDFVIDDVGPELAPILEREFPLRVDTGDCTYRVEYDLARRQVLLAILRGQRATPPPLSYLPRFRGFRICVEAGGRIVVVREAR